MKRVDYSHVFSSVFFDTPELSKIVLPEALLFIIEPFEYYF